MAFYIAFGIFLGFPRNRGGFLMADGVSQLSRWHLDTTGVVEGPE
jgi:hypothetical protein